jgi:hypothetical protein
VNDEPAFAECNPAFLTHTQKTKKQKNSMTTGIKPHCIARVSIMEKQVVWFRAV